MGGPRRAAHPRTKVRVPKAVVRRSSPSIETSTGDVTATQADKNVPNIADT
jgi:hypothetical protein